MTEDDTQAGDDRQDTTATTDAPEAPRRVYTGVANPHRTRL